jgi:hypothetical protein
VSLEGAPGVIHSSGAAVRLVDWGGQVDVVVARGDWSGASSARFAALPKASANATGVQHPVA